MPLSEKGKKVKKAVEKQYGKTKGEKVFYAMENKMKGMKKGGYAKGGVVKANCGASMKPSKGSKK